MLNISSSNESDSLPLPHTRVTLLHNAFAVGPRGDSTRSHIFAFANRVCSQPHALPSRRWHRHRLSTPPAAGEGEGPGARTRRALMHAMGPAGGAERFALFAAAAAAALSAAHGQTAFTDASLKPAAREWCADAAKADAKFGEINTWDVVRVKTFYELFEAPDAGCGSFNADIDAWQMGSVTTLYYMFRTAAKFNQPLNSWRTGSVRSMSSVFFGAAKFDQNIDSWQVGAVKSWTNTFMYATALSDCHKARIYVAWQARNARFKSQFAGTWGQLDATRCATQPTTPFKMTDALIRPAVNAWCAGATAAAAKYGGISTWDTSRVKNMRWLFEGKGAFNADIDSWKTSAVVDMA